MHHLARHAVACFLAERPFRALGSRRGTLTASSWTRTGHQQRKLDVAVVLITSSISISACTGRCRSVRSTIKTVFHPTTPSATARHADKDIYEPWLAPPDVQKAGACWGGLPEPIVDHAVASKGCIDKMWRRTRCTRGWAGAKALERNAKRTNNDSSRVDYDFIDPLPRATPSARAPALKSSPFRERAEGTPRSAESRNCQRLNLPFVFDCSIISTSRTPPGLLDELFLQHGARSRYPSGSSQSALLRDLDLSRSLVHLTLDVRRCQVSC